MRLQVLWWMMPLMVVFLWPQEGLQRDLYIQGHDPQWLSGEGEGYLLLWPQNPTQWPDGRFSLQDNNQLLLFSREGRLTQNLYHRGEGPGEFRGSFTHAALPHQSCWVVLDYLSARMVVLAEEGRLRSRWDLPRTPDSVLSLQPKALYGWWVNPSLSDDRRECWELCLAEPGHPLKPLVRRFRTLVRRPPSREPVYGGPLYSCLQGDRVWLSDDPSYTLRAVSLKDEPLPGRTIALPWGAPPAGRESWVEGLWAQERDGLWVGTALRKENLQACDLWNWRDGPHLLLRMWFPDHWHFLGAHGGTLFFWEPEGESSPQGRLGRISVSVLNDRNFSDPSNVPSSVHANPSGCSQEHTASLRSVS